MGGTKFQYHVDSDIREHKKLANQVLEKAKRQELTKKLVRVPILNGYILREVKPD